MLLLICVTVACDFSVIYCISLNHSSYQKKTFKTFEKQPVLLKTVIGDGKPIEWDCFQNPCAGNTPNYFSTASFWPGAVEASLNSAQTCNHQSSSNAQNHLSPNTQHFLHWKILQWSVWMTTQRLTHHCSRLLSMKEGVSSIGLLQIAVLPTILLLALYFLKDCSSSRCILSAFEWINYQAVYPACVDKLVSVTRQRASTAEDWMEMRAVVRWTACGLCSQSFPAVAYHRRSWLGRPLEIKFTIYIFF